MAFIKKMLQCNDFMWNIFGNDRDPLPPDWFKPCHPQWWREFYWFFIRNPLHNYTHSFIGLEGKQVRRYCRFEGQVWATQPAKWNFGIGLHLDYRPLLMFLVLANVFFFGSSLLSGWYFYLVKILAYLSWWRFVTVLFVPFISYKGSKIEWYLGWRCASGGFGRTLRKRTPQ